MVKRKVKPNKRKSKAIGLLSVAESLAMWNLISTQMFGIGGVDFFTAGTQWSKHKAGGYVTGRTGSYHTNIITLKEVIAFNQQAGQKPIGQAIVENAMANAPMIVAGTIGIPIGFKLLKRFTSKPRGQANRLLRASGFKEVNLN